MAMKDMVLLARDAQAIVFTVLFPLAFGLFFGAILGSVQSGEEGLPLAVYVADGDGDGGVLVERLRGDEAIELMEVGSEERAREVVLAGDVVGALVLGEDFELGDVFSGAARARFIADPADRLASDLLAGLITKHAGIARFAALVEGVEGGGSVPVPIELERERAERVGASPPSVYHITFAQSMVWAMMASAAAFGVSLVEERRSGALIRLRTSPGGLWAVLLGKAGACVSVSLVVSGAFVVAAWLGFGVTPGRPGLLALALLADAVAFAGLMMLLAVVGRGRTAPGQAAWAILLTAAVTGGAMLPLAFMPGWMDAISVASPVRWAILSIENGVWRSPSGVGVVVPLLVAIGIGVVGFISGGLVFARERRID